MSSLRGRCSWCGERKTLAQDGSPGFCRACRKKVVQCAVCNLWFDNGDLGWIPATQTHPMLIACCTCRHRANELAEIQSAFREHLPVIATGEHIVTDPVTGGQKGQKLARFDLLPAGPLWEIAEHFGKGAAKYSDDNWRKGYKWSLSFAAMMRHAWAFWRGEDNDQQTGSPHMAAVAFHAMVLLEFSRTHKVGDDRVKEKSHEGV